VNNKLNPALSNRPWTDDEAHERGLGNTGKRTELLKHSTLKINAELIEEAPDHWDDTNIRARTERLAAIVVQIWPRPKATTELPVSLTMAEKEPIPADEDEREPTSAASSSRPSKYQPITDWLLAQTNDSLPVSFEELEDIIGATLPSSARNHLPYWYSVDNSMGKAIAAAGFKASSVDLTAERLELRRR
jgi:hypothetical protein